jgi:hypothetical protein
MNEIPAQLDRRTPIAGEGPRGFGSIPCVYRGSLEGGQQRGNTAQTDWPHRRAATQQTQECRIAHCLRAGQA